MKILGYTIAFILALLGFLFIAFSSSMTEPPNSPIKSTFLGAVFIAWAYLLFEYIKSNYKGGPASIIGAILTGFGIYMFPDILMLKETNTPVEATATYLTSGLLILAGLILLFQGHRMHKKIAYNK